MKVEEALKIAEMTKTLYPPTNIVVLAEALKVIALEKGYETKEVKNIVSWLSDLVHVEPKIY
jgi:hypothetical protein